MISQRWAEQRRRILVVTPANLRKQWYQELTEKFSLPCRILEARSYNAALKAGHRNPFEVREIGICSYQFAKGKEPDVARVPWDLVVIDEAHRLRNVYKPSNVVANALKRAFASAPKLLLTATPLQNSLLELYGLVTFIDERTFGDVKSFRDQFTAVDDEAVFCALKARLAPICHRTLRRQVTQYVSYTKRQAILQEFTPEESEDQLYDMVSEYLQRDNLQALPASQRSLLTLVLRKLLASSTFAIAGALQTIADRLRAKVRPPEAALEAALDEDYEALDETAEEWTDDAPNGAPNGAPGGAASDAVASATRQAIEREIADLDAFARLAASIEHNAKGRALLKALDIAFRRIRDLGAQEKAIIFTESRRTQQYLLRVLGGAGFGEDIVLFNGSNTDDRSKAIYACWLEQHRGTDRVTGSRTADMRSALVEYFRDQGRIMIATEAGAEGINLQFCSLVVNYDLPWNPQRIEQRIGRYLFGGFERCLYDVQKFDSDSERRMAVILERDAVKWMRPASGQFQIFYTSGVTQAEYQPDFVAETDEILMIEVKARNEVDDADVLAKRVAAETWCGYASAFTAAHGGKTWRYSLIPHDAILENASLS